MLPVEALAWISLGLLVLNVIQIFLWGKLTHLLVDKLMSRNYAEWVQANVSAKVEAKGFVLPSDEETEHADVLQELNGMLK